ncbi:MAG: transcription antitermination factor NusB [Paludibacteraceae bacterium]|nr:transcription antitermination factor NusB [Paludibacteraceae bacterium]
MINRTLVRTKVLLTLFAYYQNEGKTKFTAEKELMRSFSDTYSLYFLLLDFVNELTTLAQQKIDDAQERAQAMHTDFNANPRFVQNRFARQLFENRTLRHYLEDQKLSWDAAHDAVENVYRQLIDSDFYKDYMSSTETSYEADKAVWRKIFTYLLADSEQMENAFDELEVTLDASGWAADMNVILSYVVKTIKRFREENGADQPLLEMFDSEDEVDFAKKLLRLTIEHSDEYEQLIADALKNWDADRIAFMDKLILKTSLAEIFGFPSIAVEITMTEYLDLAHEYSTESSPQFINGVLDQIIRRAKAENRLLKAVPMN